MEYSTYIVSTLLPLLLNKSAADKILAAESGLSLEVKIDDVVKVLADMVQRLSQEFLSRRVDPERTFDFEHQVSEAVRELGRQIVQAVYNYTEPVVESLPKHVHFEASQYTRLNHKTPQNVWTLFGQMRLQRVGYRPTDKSGDATIFPLALALGLIGGASPALAERAGGLMGEGGMTQKAVLKRLKQEYGVGWGVKKLRQVTESLAGELAEQRQEVQVEKLLALLQQATASPGRHKPGLSVGRDGITLGMRCRGGSMHEVATCGTVTVSDRRGQRLGTVYLAHVPELGQGTMSQQLTQLLREVFQRWQGPLPHLSYVTDSGDNETSYYDQVLSRMKHPRTQEKLMWTRVADYYHASERLWTLAKLLLGEGQRVTAWVRKMQKWLLKRGGVNRVLHSAATLRQQHGLRGKNLTDFGRAYRYLRDRMAYMRYDEYRRLGIPLGSGVTEAGCKTVYTQRLKLSGMRWKKEGARHILQLRVLRLSNVWDEAYRRILRGMTQAKVRGHTTNIILTSKKAA